MFRVCGEVLITPALRSSENAQNWWLQQLLGERCGVRRIYNEVHRFLMNAGLFLFFFQRSLYGTPLEKTNLSHLHYKLQLASV